MRKLIILLISILVTIAGTFLIGVYDYKVWLNPTGKNSTIITTEYKSYLVSNAVDMNNPDNPTKNTTGKIELYRLMANYKYSEEPIYHKETECFTIDIYKNLFWYVNANSETEKNHYRYEVFIYDVNYDLLRSKFASQSVPGSETVNKSSYPYLMVNFYPSEEYNSDEAMIMYTDSTYTKTMYDGETTVKGYKLKNSDTITLFDYNSTPQDNINGDKFYVGCMQFYDYSSFVDSTNKDLFDDGGFIQIDAVLEINDAGETLNYKLKNSLLQDEISEFTFDTDKVNESEYKNGFLQSTDTHEMLNNINIEGVKNYDAWVFSKYLWWHCLIAFFVFGAIMTGFYFTFSYDEKGSNVRKKAKKK